MMTAALVTTPHWPQRIGFGAPADAMSAAQDLVNYLNASGCTQASIPQCSAFQAAYNASGSPGQLTVGGQYGGNTQAALQYILDNAPAAGGGGPTQAAPNNCFGMTVPSVPGLDPTPSGGGGSSTPGAITIPTVTVTGTSSSNTKWWILGGVGALAVGGLGYVAWRRKHRH
jgi:LPXTG-motif cell wall-anchored protein